VDDSIVRGTTSEQIIEMARESGAKKVYFASAAPEIRFPNVYGIDMPSANELIAYGREIEQISELIRADGLIFQDIGDLVDAVRELNPKIKRFETSVFDGNYITGDINNEYLQRIDNLRNEASKNESLQTELSNLEMHNMSQD
jgi:amidophosphoribosyltransferase